VSTEAIILLLDATWTHVVLPATQHRWTCPALIPARQAGTQFTYHGGMEGWVDVGVVSLHSRANLPPTLIAHWRRSEITAHLSYSYSVAVKQPSHPHFNFVSSSVHLNWTEQSLSNALATRKLNIYSDAISSEIYKSCKNVRIAKKLIAGQKKNTNKKTTTIVPVVHVKWNGITIFGSHRGCVYVFIAQQMTADMGLHQRQHERCQASQAISLLSYDVDARMRMFGWLNR